MTTPWKVDDGIRTWNWCWNWWIPRNWPEKRNRRNSSAGAKRRKRRWPGPTKKKRTRSTDFHPKSLWYNLQSQSRRRRRRAVTTTVVVTNRPRRNTRRDGEGTYHTWNEISIIVLYSQTENTSSLLYPPYHIYLVVVYPNHHKQIVFL